MRQSRRSSLLSVATSRPVRWPHMRIRTAAATRRAARTAAAAAGPFRVRVAELLRSTPASRPLLPMALLHRGRRLPAVLGAAHTRRMCQHLHAQSHLHRRTADGPRTAHRVAPPAVSSLVHNMTALGQLTGCVFGRVRSLRRLQARRTVRFGSTARAATPLTPASHTSALRRAMVACSRWPQARIGPATLARAPTAVGQTALCHGC